MLLELKNTHTSEIIVIFSLLIVHILLTAARDCDLRRRLEMKARMKKSEDEMITFFLFAVRCDDERS